MGTYTMSITNSIRNYKYLILARATLDNDMNLIGQINDIVTPDYFENNVLSLYIYDGTTGSIARRTFKLTYVDDNTASVYYPGAGVGKVQLYGLR